MQTEGTRSPRIVISDDESNGIKFTMESPQRRDGRVIIHFVSQADGPKAGRSCPVAHSCHRTMVRRKNKKPFLC